MVISTTAYLFLLAALTAERIGEMLRSARNRRFALERGGMEAGAGHYPVMVAFHALFIISCAAEVLIFKRPFPGAVGWLAVAGALIAQGLRGWAIATLGKRWTTRIVVMPREPVVTAGPYRFLRHPNYLAVAIEIACVPMIHGCWLTAIVFSVGNAALLRVRIRAEERALGPDYRAAFASSPCLLPRLHRRRA